MVRSDEVKQPSCIQVHQHTIYEIFTAATANVTPRCTQGEYQTPRCTQGEYQNSKVYTGRVPNSKVYTGREPNSKVYTGRVPNSKVYTRRVPNSKPPFPAPFSTLCPNWLRHWRGIPYLCASVYCNHPYKVRAVGTSVTSANCLHSKTGEATWHQSVQVKLQHLCHT